MKKILRAFLIEVGGLYLVTRLASGIVFDDGIKGLIITGVALTLASYLIKPIINILILPLNLMTFGLFRWVSQAITLYVVDLILPNFKIIGFSFSGIVTDYISIPPIALTGIISYIAFSLLLSILTTFIFWFIG